MNDALPHEPVVAAIADGLGSEGTNVDAGRRAAGVELATLASRLDALEAQVRELRDLRPIEDRITNRVLERIPIAGDAPAREPGKSWYQRANPFRKTSAASAAATGWILVDLFQDLRMVVVMMFDRHFVMSWTSRGLIVLALLIAITSSVWLSPFSLIPLIGSTIQRILDTILVLMCGGLLFKVLHRETQRYRLEVEERKG